MLVVVIVRLPLNRFERAEDDPFHSACNQALSAITIRGQAEVYGRPDQAAALASTAADNYARCDAASARR